MSKKHKHKHSEEEGGEAWLLPYSDLMTLLLAVFIVLFAVSKLDSAKAEEMATSFSENMISGGGGGILSGEGTSIVPGYPEESTDKGNSEMSQEELEEFLGKYELESLEALEAKLDVLFKNADMSSDVTTSIDSRGLVISLNNAILFDPGSADIKIENEDTLFRIAETINALDNYIRIEGHTDNLPISTSVYPSNWELSAARATSVVRLFIEKCKVSPDKLVAVGYGEYKPIGDNSTPEGRAQNRRIDIIVLSEKYNNLED